MANIFVAATATWNGKALKGARKDINTFEKQIQKLGRTIGVSLSAAALINYSKKAVNAFAADEKAAKALEQQLKNTGYQFSAPGVEMYIANLQKVSGVLDDELRPAFQSLLTVTGSITLSQEALNTALNVSAATGKSLAEVSQALAKGYSGQTTALSRLGAGLSKATIKTGDMDKILGELNDKFAGQAQARLSTYSGKMDLLRVASANVSEEIGKGIIGALEALSQDTSIEQTTKKMENLGKTTGNTIKGLGVLIAEIKKVPGLSTVKDILTYGNIFNTLGKLNEINQRGKYPTAPARETPAMGRIAAQQRKLEAAALKNGVALRKAENDQLKAKTEVDKLKDKFDVERIGLMKALNEATDAETILRLNAKIAILDNNEALAKKINAELEAGKKAKELADAFGSATSALDIQIAKLRGMTEDIINKINQKTAAGLYNPTGLTDPRINQLFPPAQGPLGGIDYTVPMGSGNPVYAPGVSGTPMSYADVRLTIDVAQSGDQFAQLIADSVQVAQRSGYSTTSAGSLNP
tara:strand:+ start:1523 stop:3100 length:1578 start_codon:yes stop_codon:yes gene_type:complete